MLQSRFFFLFAAAATLAAQDPRGKILGVITDASGAVIPSAKITATEVEMNTHVSAVSNAGGNFELPYLVPGPYQITVIGSGFKRYTRGPIEVRVGDAVTLNVQLEVGAVTESVEVKAEAPILETTSGSVGRVMDRHDLTNLPMAEGNPKRTSPRGLVSPGKCCPTWCCAAVMESSSTASASTSSRPCRRASAGPRQSCRVRITA